MKYLDEQGLIKQKERWLPPRLREARLSDSLTPFC